MSVIGRVRVSVYLLSRSVSSNPQLYSRRSSSGVVARFRNVLSICAFSLFVWWTRRSVTYYHTIGGAHACRCVDEVEPVAEATHAVGCGKVRNTLDGTLSLCRRLATGVCKLLYICISTCLVAHAQHSISTASFTTAQPAQISTECVRKARLQGRVAVPD